MTALPEAASSPAYTGTLATRKAEAAWAAVCTPAMSSRQGGRHDARAGQGPHQGRGLSQAGLLQAGGKAAQQDYRQEGGRGLQRGGDFVPDQPGKCPKQPV